LTPAERRLRERARETALAIINRVPDENVVGHDQIALGQHEILALVQAEKDAQLRRAFAALCHFCAGEYAEVWRDGMTWRHGQNAKGPLCCAWLIRNREDPSGRLAKP
jgi:hypothetical protein